MMCWPDTGTVRSVAGVFAATMPSSTTLAGCSTVPNATTTRCGITRSEGVWAIGLILPAASAPTLRTEVITDVITIDGAKFAV
jgi:hypothetical protein